MQAELFVAPKAETEGPPEQTTSSKKKQQARADMDNESMDDERTSYMLPPSEAELEDALLAVLLDLVTDGADNVGLVGLRQVEQHLERERAAVRLALRLGLDLLARGLVRHALQDKVEKLDVLVHVGKGGVRLLDHRVVLGDEHGLEFARAVGVHREVDERA